MQHTDENLENNVKELSAQIEILSNQIASVKKSEDYLGGSKGYQKYLKLQCHFQKLQYKYWIAKRGCLDLISCFAEMMPSKTSDIASEIIMMRAGIDPRDFDDKDI